MTEEQQLAAFEAKIARGEKIEPGDWMPEEYRKQLIRIISQHAHSEIVGTLPEGEWIPHAPGFKRKLAVCAKVQDEAGHCQLLYRAAETLGITREQMISDFLAGRAKYANVFNYPAKTWADCMMIAWIVDAHAICNQQMLARGSYGPYARAMARICYEESFHMKHGIDGITALAKGTPAQKQMAQEALNRWWWPTLMMSGPDDSHSKHLPTLMKWKIKDRTNNQIRQEFIALVVPGLREIGLEPPDPELRYDSEKKEWQHGPIDWEEFARVINGDGPCNAERMAARRAAHEEGRWVREALAVRAHRLSAA
jgi:ring-1,2-phenylacetyl-CoA epoxidase subunit PaaA